MLTLHHLEYSQSFRILWLLEELGAEYELKSYNRDPESNLAPDEYKALSPLGTAPVVSDGDLVLAESNAIIDYIMDSYLDSALVPKPGSADRARHLFWYHASPASMMNIQGVAMILGLLENRTPWPISSLLKAVFGQVRKLFINPRTEALYALMEKDLGEKAFFGGDALTTADITLIYSMVAAQTKGAFETYPNIKAWFERVEAMPSFKAARAKDDRPHIDFRF